MVAIFTVTNGANKGSVQPDAGWYYTQCLNDINEAELKFSGTGAVKRSLMAIGAKISIYDDSTLKFYGTIDNVDYFTGGTICFHASGEEVWLGKERGTYASSPWVATASATIFSSIIGESSYFTAGTIAAGITTDFRLATSTSLWSAIGNLANKTTQDVVVNYGAMTVGISNHIGSSTVVATLNDGKEISNVRRSVGLPRGNKIKVWGKGDGDLQITGTDSDAASIALYGEIVKDVTDPSIISTDEADALASSVLSMEKDPPNIYDFDLNNPDYGPLSLGDHIKLNALDQDANNVEVRVVGIEKGEKAGREYTTLQTTNPELRTLLRRQGKVLADLRKQATDSNTYMQGNGNVQTFGTGINAKLSYPAKVGFYISPALFEDETGALRITSITADYDVDPYNNQYGSATFTGTDPQVQNDSGNTGPGVSGNSSNTSPAVSGTSADSGTSALADTGTTSTTTNTITSSYVKIADINPNSTNTGGLFINVGMGRSSQTDYSRMEFKVESSSGTTYCSAWATYAASDDVTQLSACNIAMFIPENTGSYTYDVYCRYGSSVGATSETNWLARTGWITLALHSHSDGSYAADSHLHADGTFTADSHLHPDGSYDVNAADINHISIGDGVGEAGAVNATNVALYLDYYTGGAWVNKVTIAATGAILGNGVDISGGGVYPDAAGYWRLRVDPNSASADFIQARVVIKHNLDN